MLNRLRSWLSDTTACRPQGAPPASPRQTRLAVEPLEGREVPAALNFTFTYDPSIVNGLGGNFPLFAANLTAAGNGLSTTLRATAPSAVNVDVYVGLAASGGGSLGLSFPTVYVVGPTVDGLGDRKAGTIYEGQTGSDPNGVSSDPASYDIQMTFYADTLGALWLDPNAPSRPSVTVVPTNQYELIGVAQHQLIHGLGFDGYRDSTGGFPTGRWSTFDQNTQFDVNGTAPVPYTRPLYFIGEEAVKVYGRPVPVSYNTYHVAENAIGRGADLANDMMESTLPIGTRFYPSALDYAMLSDLGWARANTWVTIGKGRFSADGLDDILQFNEETGQVRLSRSTGSSFADVTWSSFNPAVNWKGWVVGDFDGNGFDDFGAYQTGGNAFWISRTNNVGTAANTPEIHATFSNTVNWRHFGVGDFDNNGLDDVGAFHQAGGTYYVRLSGVADTAPYAGFSSVINWTAFSIGDFDGNGKDDVGAYEYSGGGFYAYLSGTGNPTLGYAGFSNTREWTNFRVGDFDGNGRDDIGAYSKLDSTYFAHLSGVGSVAYAGFSGDRNWTGFTVGDFDNNGKDDIGAYSQQDGAYFVYRSGTGNPTLGWASYSGSVGWGAFVAGDFNGDGKDDLGGYLNSSDTWYVSLTDPSGTFAGPALGW